VDAVILEDFDRGYCHQILSLTIAAPLGTGSAKLGGNYAPVFKYSAEAKHKGFPITLHLDSKTRTYIDEFSTSNFVALLKEPSTQHTTFVVPESSSILKSVTTKSLIELSKSFGWPVEMRAVPWPEVAKFTEVAACGTAAVITVCALLWRRADCPAY
jgi:branched-chain amino acid aminotransferase